MTTKHLRVTMVDYNRILFYARTGFYFLVGFLGIISAATLGTANRRINKVVDGEKIECGLSLRRDGQTFEEGPTAPCGYVTFVGVLCTLAGFVACGYLILLIFKQTFTIAQWRRYELIALVVLFIFTLTAAATATDNIKKLCKDLTRGNDVDCADAADILSGDKLAKKAIRNLRSSRDSAWGYWVMLLLIGGIVALEEFVFKGDGSSVKRDTADPEGSSAQVVPPPVYEETLEASEA
eukprot:m.266912 g.266912  ORF g.266912 m.266912 type:complete len:237 (-) comp17631_c0_seq2:1883-2593(-)